MHPVTEQHVIYAMDKSTNPSMRVDNGAVITINTPDCFNNQIKSENQPLNLLNWKEMHPAAGPIFINEAEPGDILAVTIEKIQIMGHATILTAPGLGLLGGELEEHVVRHLPIVNNKLIFSKKMAIPIKKRIGIIGTAPSGMPVPCSLSDTHGGNIGSQDVKEGTTLFLPVNVSGALLALGNIHIALADGEVSFSGASIPSQVTVRLQVVKNKQWPTPSLICEDKIITIASAPTLDEASIIATRNMTQLLTATTHTLRSEAIMLLSLAGDLRISQVNNKTKVARMELPLHYWSENPFL